MNREQALQLLENKVQTKNLIKHCLAVEAIMRELAEYYGENREEWGLAGLLHDIDYEETKEDMARHSKVGADFLRQQGLSEEICQAVLKHNEAHGLPLESKIEKALFVADPMSGLVVAAALVLPSKKLADLTPKNILHRFREKSFAKGANREIIRQCESLLDLPLEKFAELSLTAMQKVSGRLGL